MQLLEEEEKLLLSGPATHTHTHFLCLFYVVTVAVEMLSIMKPDCNPQGGSILTLQPLTICPILQSEQVSWGQKAGGNENRGGKCFQPGIYLLISVCALCSALWGEENKSLIFTHSGRQLEAHALPHFVTEQIQAATSVFHYMARNLPWNNILMIFLLKLMLIFHSRKNVF